MNFSEFFNWNQWYISNCIDTHFYLIKNNFNWNLNLPCIINFLDKGIIFLPKCHLDSVASSPINKFIQATGVGRPDEYVELLSFWGIRYSYAVALQFYYYIKIADKSNSELGQCHEKLSWKVPDTWSLSKIMH